MGIPTLGMTWTGATSTTPAIITYSLAEERLEDILDGRYSEYPALNDTLTATQADLFQQATRVWEQAAGVDFVLVGDSPWTQLRVGLASIDGPGKVLGGTTLWDEATHITHVALAFDAADTATADYTTTQAPPGVISFYQLALHELGHVLGLGHTNIASDLMYPYANGTVTLSNDDIATITSLYGPSITVPPPAVDMYSYEAVIQKCYVAYYGRPSDPAGLAYWTGRLATGNGNIDEVIDAFANSAESLALYGDLSATSVVDRLYDQLFSRSPEEEGLQYWTHQIETGTFSRQSVMLRIADGAQGQDLAILTNKVTAAELFTNSYITGYGAEDIQDVRTWLSGVTIEPPYQEQVTAAIEAIGVNLPGFPADYNSTAYHQEWLL
jgi:hypothetical protein